ncbi:hypothetical protein BVC80_9099g53 [Macleaya cordata]|uniref:S locus-related glycoprotein 1 binding pollen coat n=1 Tax=Macleaya cordata TaxID=56857 RepID=A0A200PVL8_MACCD|nr:hypothetical protein BVC80_9099g53 [Macleaya cordata]
MARSSIIFIGFLLVSIVLSASYMKSEALDCSFYSEEVERTSPTSSAGTINVNKRYVKKTSGHVLIGPCYDKTNCEKLCAGVVGGFQSDCIDRSPGESVCACCHHQFDHIEF